MMKISALSVERRRSQEPGPGKQLSTLREISGVVVHLSKGTGL